ncbi:MAG: hypothetical protein ABIP17_10455 [Ilumatobacteraceae bacterium]
MGRTDISPVPTDDEAAAIVTAIEALWPKPPTVQLHERQGSPTWRFSGRWWHRDRRAPADRPWA